MLAIALEIPELPHQYAPTLGASLAWSPTRVRAFRVARSAGFD